MTLLGSALHRPPEINGSIWRFLAEHCCKWGGSHQLLSSTQLMITNLHINGETWWNVTCFKPCLHVLTGIQADLYKKSLDLGSKTTTSIEMDPRCCKIVFPWNSAIRVFHLWHARSSCTLWDVSHVCWSSIPLFQPRASLLLLSAVFSWICQEDFQDGHTHRHKYINTIVSIIYYYCYMLLSWLSIIVI